MPYSYQITQYGAIALMYVGFKRIAPEYASSFDLTNEYALALKMFEERRGQ